ncbi:MAG: redoxin family protein [SAR324 cluster bacterium]|nr:redoxin family protein [SAR324 cluster bacterium]
MSPTLYAEDLVGREAPDLSGELAPEPGKLKVSDLLEELKFVEQGDKYLALRQRNVVVLNFFATWCVPCIREIPAFNRLAQSMKDQPVKFLYVNVDQEITQATVKKMIAKYNLRVPVLLPQREYAVEAYGADALPRIVMIDRAGKIAEVITGFEDHLEEKLKTRISELLKNP